MFIKTHFHKINLIEDFSQTLHVQLHMFNSNKNKLWYKRLNVHFSQAINISNQQIFKKKQLMHNQKCRNLVLQGKVRERERDIESTIWSRWWLKGRSDPLSVLSPFHYLDLYNLIIQ